jgi:hypothetical protein
MVAITAIFQMVWFVLCCVLCATIAASSRRTVDAFGFSSTNENQQHGRTRTTSFRLHETTSDVDATSAKSVSDAAATAAAPQTVELFDSVVRCIDALYPPQGLDQRIALSRKDGYWPFISAGEDPPQELVYGEFDVALLEQALQRSLEILGREPKNIGKNDDDDNNNNNNNNNSDDDDEIVFCDMGSGTGRLVLAAAALHPNWKLCKGIELLETIHEEALEKLESCRRPKPPTVAAAGEEDNQDQLQPTTNEENENEDPLTEAVLNSDFNVPASENTEFSLASNDSNDGPSSLLPLAPIELECGSFADPYSSFYNADILFCFSTAMPNHIIIDLARSIGRQCRPGTIVITTEYKLPSGGVLDPLPDDSDYPSGDYQIELLETLSGDCTAVGGESTVFLQKVVQSVGTGERRVEPTLPVSELAYRAIIQMEENDTSTVFLRQASNQMAFLGFPDRWRPKSTI